MGQGTMKEGKGKGDEGERIYRGQLPNGGYEQKQVISAPFFRVRP